MNNKILTVVSLCILALCSVSSGGIVKSNVGGREIGFIEQEEDNPIPYVTSGLVAMWDGEWNAGVGIHEYNISEWKDLIGTNDLHVLDGVETTDYAILFHGGRMPTQIWSYTIPETVTLEVVMWGGSSSSRPNESMRIFVGNRKIILKMNGAILGWYQRGTAQFSYEINTITSMSVTYQSLTSMEVESFFKNGENIELSSDGNSRSVPGVCIGNDSISSDPLWNTSVGGICCIRCYNRKLSENEVMHNYGIDKERFFK